jgi:hypothetical protein
LPRASKSVPGCTVHQASEIHFLYSINFQLIPIALDLKIQNISLLQSKIFQTWHGGRFESIVQLSPWAQLEIPKRISCYKFWDQNQFDFSMNLKGVQTSWKKYGKFTKNLS